MFAKKSLGQHFLHSPNVIEKIITAAEFTGKETVLEIGPGKGVLTERLLEHAQRVVAIEKDRRLIPELSEKFKASIAEGKLTVVEGDALSVDIEHLGLTTNNFSLVANIPYYITGEILRTYLSGKMQPNLAILLVQKEVAERIARSKKESLLSLSVKVYGRPSYIATVPKGAFRPTPKVDSAILKIEQISRNFFADIDETFFFAVLKKGFGQKRKQLVGNLSSFAPRETILGIFDDLKLPPDVRAEDIPVSTWKNVANTLKLSTKSSYEDAVS